MWEFLQQQMMKYPKSCLMDKETSYSYLQVIDKVYAYSEDLKKKLKSGSKCGIICSSNMNTAMAILACWCAELVPIPMSVNYGKRHCESILELTRPDVLITDYDRKYDEVCTYHINSRTFSGILREVTVEKELEKVSVVMCTSGTTGVPKGVMLLKEGLKKNVLNILNYFKITNLDTIVIARPIYHSAVLTGELLVSLFRGTNIYFCDNKYNPISLVNCIEECKATIICGTPTLLNHMAYFVHRSQKAITINKVVISGECMTKDLAKNIRCAFKTADIYNVYGLTEASPRVSYLKPELFDDFPQSVGAPLNNTEIKIIDKQSGIEVLDNIPGILYVNSPSIMKGYYKEPEKTRTVVKNNWLNTHDIAYKDKKGLLYIVCRDDDMIIKAGMNIYPKEIEKIINEVKEIEECMVYGIKGLTGENIAIDVVLKKEYYQYDKKKLMNIFKDILPDYLMPTYVNIVKSILINGSGKRVGMLK